MYGLTAVAWWTLIVFAPAARTVSIGLYEWKYRVAHWARVSIGWNGVRRRRRSKYSVSPAAIVRAPLKQVTRYVPPGVALFPYARTPVRQYARNVHPPRPPFSQLRGITS